MKIRLALLAALTSTLVQAQTPPAQQPTVTVLGRAEVRIPNTEAAIQLGCEGAGTDEAAVRDDVGSRSQAVAALLKRENAARLQTTSVSIQPQFSPMQPEPGRQAQTPEVLGYTGRSMVGFVVPVEEAGRIITAALDAGANSVVAVQTQPADETRRDAESKVLSLAAKDAETQARALVSALGLSWAGIRGIDASGNPPGPFPMPRAAMMMGAETAPGLDIQGGETVVAREVVLKAEFRTP
ncbi:MAG: SIMPL domain-containing protein [Chthoniobacterales bacterium]|nr:SIMPL domain-containing protein [Chthoniobacterales bacterium]